MRRLKTCKASLLVLLLAAAGASLLGAGCGGGDETSPGGREVRLVIPAGATEKVKRGESVAGIPDRIEARVGDTLIVVNNDDSTQYVSGFSVSPGQRMEIPLNRAGTYLTNCSAHRDRSIKMIVTDPEGATTDAEDETTTLFTDAGCGGCHRLDAAGTQGPMGPDLDESDLGADEVSEIIRDGRGPMPAYENRLSPEEIDRLAELIAGPDHP